MTGRKNPDMTEGERDREYWLQQKRGYGEKVVGDEAEFLDEAGVPAEVAKERMQWKKNHELGDLPEKGK